MNNKYTVDSEENTIDIKKPDMYKIKFEFTRDYLIIDYKEELHFIDSLIFILDSMEKNKKFIYVSGVLINLNNVDTVKSYLNNKLLKFDISHNEMGLLKVKIKDDGSNTND